MWITDPGTKVFTVYCNTCKDKKIKLNNTIFKRALEELHNADWRKNKVDDTWEHYCPDCVREWASKQPPRE